MSATEPNSAISSSSSSSSNNNTTVLPVRLRGVPWLILACGLGLSWAGYETAQRNFGARMQEQFLVDAAEAQGAIDQRLRAYGDFLYGLQALFVSSDTVTRQDFGRYIASVDVYKRYLGIEVTAFTRRVLPADRAAFEARVRSDTSRRPEGYPDYRIKPPGERSEYFVIDYVEPYADNEALLGFDQGSEAMRRTGIERVRDSGALTASGRIELLRDAARNISTAAFQLRLPIYRPGAPLASVEQRRTAFIGSVGSAFRVDNLVSNTVSPRLRGRLRVVVHDAGTEGSAALPADDKTLLFDGLSETRAAPTLWQGKPLVHEQMLAVGDRLWRVQYHWHRVLPPGHLLGAALLVGGSLISLLLALLAHGLLRSRQTVALLRESSSALIASERKVRENEERLRNLNELSSDWSWESDAEHRFVGFSGEIENRSGVSTGAHYGKRRWEIPYVGVSDAEWDAHRALLARREPFLGLVMGRPRADGGIEYVSISGRPVFSEGGQFTGYRGVGSNITLQRQAQLRLQLENQITRILVDNEPFEAVLPKIIESVCQTLGWACGAAWRLTPDAGHFECFASWAGSAEGRAMYRELALHALPADHHGMIGGAWFDGQPVWHQDLQQVPGFRRAALMLEAGLHSGFSFPVINAGAPVCVLEFFSGRPLAPNPFFMAMAEPVGIQIAQFWQRRHTEAELHHSATHDALTGLPNRTLFAQAVEQAVALARRGNGSVALLFVDLDRFKQINDTLGHAAGDTLLREVARRLAALVRDSDMVARQGGDEFVILAQGHGDRSNVAVLADRVITAMTVPFVLEAADYTITASVGISVFPDDCSDGATLLRNADAAMYRAKRAGRSNFQFYSEQLTANALERMSLERSLRRAEERGELRLVYQPKRTVASGKLSGLEALLRWQHPERGLLSPDSFVPIAEESGLIVGIGAWVLDEACRQLRQWRAAGLAVPHVAVNISARQFGDGRLPGLVRAALDAHGLPGNLLEIELTETLIMSEPERAIEALKEVRALGVSIAIDDLGTGYSSLAYLQRFPISSVKIDRSFITGLPADEGSAKIVSALIGLGHNLGLKVVAEGVETEAQLALLAAHQCDEVQGFAISHPLTAEACTAYLREQAAREVPRHSGVAVSLST